jgi:hypothetical protein
MKTKAVYVLTSSPNDYYYEQLLMSVYSLKLYNPDMQTVLVTDTTTNETLAPGRNRIKGYFDDIIVVDIPKRFGKEQCSRYLKTSLRPLVDGDFIYIDVDTIICDSLSELDELDVEIGAVPDLHKNTQYFNSGVMYSKDTLTAHKLYELWHELWLEDVQNGNSKDQHSLNLANRKLKFIVMTISDIWNCQIRNFPICWNRANIVHYFAYGCKSAPKISIEQPSIILTMRADDGISEDIDFMIKNARMYFGYELFLLLRGVDKKDYCAWLRRCYPSIFGCFDSLAHIVLFVGERSKWLKCKLAKKRK